MAEEVASSRHFLFKDFPCSRVFFMTLRTQGGHFFLVASKGVPRWRGESR